MGDFCKALLCFAGLVCFAGCVDDDTESCPVPFSTVDVTFHYLAHRHGERDLFTSDVDHVNLLVYEKTAGLVEEFEGPAAALTNGTTLTLSLPAGEYTLVAWGNLNGFSDHTLNCAADLRGSLLSALTITDIDGLDAHLFYGKVSFKLANEKKRTVPLEMVRNTTDIQVVLDGVRVLPSRSEQTTGLSVRIYADNVVYDFDNNTVPQTDRVTYLPSYSFLSDEVLQVDTRVLRLFRDDDSIISITDPANWQNQIVYEGSLSQLIMLKYPTVRDDYDFLIHDSFKLVFELAYNEDTYSIAGIFGEEWEEIITPPGNL